MHVVIFEGSRWGVLAPASLSRPVFMLASGAGTLLEKQIRRLKPSRLTLWVRPELEGFCRRRVVPNLAIPTQINEPLDDAPALLANGRVVLSGDFDFPTEGEAVATDTGDVIRLAFVRRRGLTPGDVLDRTPRWLDLLRLPRVNPKARLIDSLCELIHWNGESLAEDFEHRDFRNSLHRPGPWHLVNESAIFLGVGVKLSPGCVLDASAGPVVIEAGASIGANAVVLGPCRVGPHVRVRPLTQIRENTSIGPVCTVGGEIGQSILIGYCNKAHDGFLGHSYLGEWVNLGSGTTTSNLKNTYGEIRTHVEGCEVPTGRQFLGSVFGDHAKTAILTRLSAGTYVGFSSMTAGSGTAPRLIPSYTFLTDGGAREYQLDKAMEVARRVFARRDWQFDEKDEALMRYVAGVAPRVEAAR